MSLGFVANQGCRPERMTWEERQQILADMRAACKAMLPPQLHAELDAEIARGNWYGVRYVTRIVDRVNEMRREGRNEASQP